MTGNGDRALSTAITHPLTLAITAVLISALLLGSGQVLEEQENRAAREQLSEIGSDVVSQIERLDSLNGTGERVNASVRLSYPDRVAGEDYTINVTDDDDSFPFETDHALEIRSRGLDQPVQYPLVTDTTLDARSRAQGGTVALCLEGGDLALGRECP